VARSFTQRQGVDYNNSVFSLVVKHKFLWMLLAMVVELNLDFEQINVKIVFLYEDLEVTNNIWGTRQEGLCL